MNITILVTLLTTLCTTWLSFRSSGLEGSLIFIVTAFLCVVYIKSNFFSLAFIGYLIFVSSVSAVGLWPFQKFVKKICFVILLSLYSSFFPPTFALPARDNIGVCWHFPAPVTCLLDCVNEPVPSYCNLYDYSVNQEDLIK